MSLSCLLCDALAPEQQMLEILSLLFKVLSVPRTGMRQPGFLSLSSLCHRLSLLSE